MSDTITDGKILCRNFNFPFYLKFLRVYNTYLEVRFKSFNVVSIHKNLEVSWDWTLGRGIGFSSIGEQRKFRNDISNFLVTEKSKLTIKQS